MSNRKYKDRIKQSHSMRENLKENYERRVADGSWMSEDSYEEIEKRYENVEYLMKEGYSPKKIQEETGYTIEKIYSTIQGIRKRPQEIQRKLKKSGHI